MKHEYLEGKIYAIPGGTPARAELSVAVAATLRAQLEGKGRRVFSSAQLSEFASPRLDVLTGS